MGLLSALHGLLCANVPSRVKQVGQPLFCFALCFVPLFLRGLHTSSTFSCGMPASLVRCRKLAGEDCSKSSGVFWLVQEGAATARPVLAASFPGQQPATAPSADPSPPHSVMSH